MLESNMRCFEQKYEIDNKIIIIGGKSDEDEKQSRIRAVSPSTKAHSLVIMLCWPPSITTLTLPSVRV